MEVFDQVLNIGIVVCFALLLIIGAVDLFVSLRYLKKHWHVICDGEEFEHVVDLDVDKKRKCVTFWNVATGEQIILYFVDLRVVELVPVEHTDPEA